MLDAYGEAVEMTAEDGRHTHNDPVTLPGDLVVWACSHTDPEYGRGQPPAFGLYFDERWDPPWPSALVDWPDFGLPVDEEAFDAALDDLIARARAGDRVAIGCLGGHGRTGTFLGCMALRLGLADDPVDWVRSVYCPDAIETEAQAAFVRQRSTDQPASGS